MQSSMIKSITEDFGNGGTIDGDLTISGDLQVNGGGSLSFDEIVQGTQVIDVTNTEALLVRKNDDGGDVFIVDTTNSGVGINTSAGGWSLNVKGVDANVFKVLASDGNTLSFLQGTNGDATQKWFADGNVTKVLINTNGSSYFTGGNVGIGTASPTSKLSVSAGRGANTGLEILDSADSNNKRIDLRLDADGDGYLSLVDASETTKVQLYSNGVSYFNGGNVGIGRTPTQKLDIYASSGNQTIMNELGGGGNAELRLKNNAGDRIIRASADKLQFIDNADSRADLTIDGSGNIGIGTASPDYQLELEKAGGGFLSFKTTDTEIVNNDVLGTIQFGADDATASGIDIGAKIVATATDNFQSASSNVDAPTKLEFFTQDNTTTDVMSTVGATLTLGGDDQNATFAGDVYIKNPTSNDPATLSLWSADTSIADNDNIGVILAQGSDSGGSPPYTGAKIEFNADAVWDTGTSNYYATRIDFFTQSNSGADTLANPALTIDSSQNSTFTGAIKQFRDDSSTVGTNDVVIENDGSGDASLKFSLTGATDWYAYVDNSDSDKFKIRRSTTDHFSIDESGNATFAGDVTTGGTVNVIGASSATATLNINANNGASTNNKVRFLKETGAEFKLQMNTGGVSSFANLVNFKGTGTTFNNNVTVLGQVTTGNVSGSATSTGSFGHGYIDSQLGIGTVSPTAPIHIQHSSLSGFDSHADDLLVIERTGGVTSFNMAVDTDQTSYLMFSDTTRHMGSIAYFHDGDTMRFRVGATNVFDITSTTIQPVSDNAITLGTSSKRWADVFATQTTTGGVFETGLRTEKIGDNPTGTIVSWEEDGLVPCDKNEDELVMGVIKKGKDEPIVLGAEPVLVTGKVNVGDYIVTSDKIGHGKSVKRGYLLKKDLFGKVIAQALESCDGDSNLIKCMIRKM